MSSHAQALSRWEHLRRATPPRSLAALLVIVAIAGLGWALTVPPWQSPDEVAHFAYAQSLAESGRLPGAKSRPALSSDQSAADAAVGASRGAFYPQASPPNWSAADYRAYLAQVHGLHPPSRSDGGGPNPASANPPFYYGFADVAYLIDRGGTTFGRLYAMQIWGVLLLLASTVGAWLLAGETFGRRRLPQLACAAVVGLLPMDTFIATSVNPDAMMIPLWTIALWLGARVINHRGRRWDAVALCGVTAAAVLTKATSYALVVPVVLALLIAWRRRPGVERSAALRGLSSATLALVLPILGWIALADALHRSAINTVAAAPGRHPFGVGRFVSYLWQFYLPRLPFLTPIHDFAGLPLYDVWLRQGTGAFGWLAVALPSWMYVVATVLVAALAIAVVSLLVRLREGRALALLSFFVLALIALLVLLHVTDYRSFIDGAGPILQGRYLLPAVALLGLAVGLVVTRLPVRWRAPSCGLVLTGLLTAQLISLATVTQAYYL